MPNRIRSSRTEDGRRGFSLIEILVAIVIMIVAVLGMLALFDRSNKMSKVENNVTDEQQSARYASYQLVREVRMTGAGSLPQSTLVGGIRQLGISLSLGSTTYNNGKSSNNVDSTFFVGPSGGRFHVRKGTDILHIRGVITNALYDLGSASWIPPAGGSPGTLVIQPCTKFTDPTSTPGTPCYPNGRNDLSIYTTAASLPLNRLFVMSDQLGNVGVGLIVPPLSTQSGPNSPVTLKIDVTDPYVLSLNPGGAFPGGLSNPSRGGVMDDRVYFVTDGPAAGVNCPLPKTAALRAIAEQSPGPCHPGLMVADWGPTAPGASNPFGGDNVTVTPIADDIENMQISYGYDFYDLACNRGTFASPAPPETLGGSSPCGPGQPAPYPSDASLSITDLSTFNTIVTNARGSSPPNQDPSESATAGADEWIWNVPGEPVGGTLDWNSDLTRVRAVEIALLAKGQHYAGATAKANWIGALDWPLMDSTNVVCPTVSDPTSGNGLAYHRRAQSVRVDLRNFQTQ